MTFGKIFYNVFVVPLLWLIFQIGSLFNDKIRRGLNGRRNLFERLTNKVSQLRSTQRVWFHSSSMGEFEQAKPIIAAIKKHSPPTEIIVTFFSPSGYEHSLSYKLASIISYIPFDSAANAKKFIEITKPTAAVMVRYDIWPNMIWALHENNIPIFIANATMSKKSLRLLPLLRRFHKSLYDCFSHILTVSESDKTAFSLFGISRPMLEAVGDTRYDQVALRSQDAVKRHILPSSLLHYKKIFIVGQSWEPDNDVVLPVVLKLQKKFSHLLTIIVPHEPTVENIETIEFKLTNKTSVIRLSEISEYNSEQVILVDSIGVLIPLYQYAHVVYVGGSFRQGIHNVLEPAAFSVPVIYGPKHTNSQEAVMLARLGGGFVITNESELYLVLLSLLENDTKRTTAGKISRTLVDDHCGATDRFMKHLIPLLDNASR